MNGEFKDTVEEFWNRDILVECCDRGPAVSVESFLNDLRSLLEADGCVYAFRSAREALRDLLRSGAPQRGSKVLVSSFTCVAVAQAIVSAGHVPETFDVANREGAIDWEQMASRLRSGYAAIVVPHLFGVPSDFRPLLSSAARSGVLIIEDCAHSLVARIGDRVAGTIGDAAIFSFNYDKPISLAGGGALLVNNAALAARLKVRQPVPDYESELKEVGRFLNFLVQRRRGFGREPLLRNIQLRFGNLLHKERRNGLFCAAGIGPIRSALGVQQLRQYRAIVNLRNRNAERLRSALGRNTWHVDSDVRPAWLRQKITLDSADPETVIAKARSIGVRIGRFNWAATIDEYLGLPPRPNSEYLSRHSLDLPIHQNMTDAELGALITVLGRHNAQL